jgi:predicted secreted protein
MHLFTNFLLFTLIWWIIFFITLPIKVSIPSKQKEGHASSAPIKTYIGLKVLITSALSAIIMIFLLFIKFDLGVIFKQ